MFSLFRISVFLFVSIILFTTVSYAESHICKVKVTVAWDYDNSKAPDLKGFILYKYVTTSDNSTGYKEFKYIEDPNARTYSFFDYVSESNPTIYAMKAIDDSNLTSDFSNNASVTVSSCIQPIIEYATVDPSTSVFAVKFKILYIPDDFNYFDILFSTDNNSFISLGTISDPNQTTFSKQLDQSIIANNNILYIRVDIVDNSNHKSKSLVYPIDLRSSIYNDLINNISIEPIN